MATKSRFLLLRLLSELRAHAGWYRSSASTSSQGRVLWRPHLRHLSCSHTLYKSPSPSTGRVDQQSDWQVSLTLWFIIHHTESTQTPSLCSHFVMLQSDTKIIPSHFQVISLYQPEQNFRYGKKIKKEKRQKYSDTLLWYLKFSSGSSHVSVSTPWLESTCDTFSGKTHLCI